MFTSRPSTKRVAITLVLATALAGSMLLVATWKRSAPVGSVTAAIYESVIVGMSIAAVFVPFVAMPIAKNGKRS